jgi:hypothetical protein
MTKKMLKVWVHLPWEALAHEELVEMPDDYEKMSQMQLADSGENVMEDLLEEWTADKGWEIVEVDQHGNAAKGWDIVEEWTADKGWVDQHGNAVDTSDEPDDAAAGS